MAKVLVTGATGFIGRACLNALEQTNLEIHAIYHNKPLISSKNIQWHHCDIFNIDKIDKLLNQIKPEYLIHLAWIVDHKICMSSELNINYVFASVHLYKQFGIYGGKKAIFLGTCAEYDGTDTACNEEKILLKPSTLYGLCKNQTLELVRQLKLQQPTYADFTWLRIFHIYGPYEHENRLIPYVFYSYLKGVTPVLDNPYSVRDYIYVKNLAEIIVHLLVNKSSDLVINAGSDNPLSIEELVKYIHQRFFKNQPPPCHRSGVIKKYDYLVPELQRLKKINIKPSISFDQSLDESFEWFKHQYEHCLVAN